MQRLVVILAALAVLAVFEAVFLVMRGARARRREALMRRLRNLGSSSSGSSLLRAGKLARSPFLDELLSHVPLARRLEGLLERTDLRLTVAQLLAYSVGASLGGLGVALVLHLALGAALAMALGLLCLPTLAVFVSYQRRSLKLSEQLPDALDMMARSLRAGHALTSSFELLASELQAPIALEFGRAYESQKLGMPLERTVLQMAGRAPANRDLKIFAVSVIVQKETGGNLAEILEKIAETVRARYRFFGKLRALTAEGKASGWVLAALPVGMASFLMMSNPKYLEVLLVDPLGQLILGYAAGSWVVGLGWINQMTKLEV